MTSRYEVEAVLGRGSMGVVYRARQVGAAHRVVALKRVASDDRLLIERLRREAQILASLDHPNIVRIDDVLEDADGVAIVLQYAAGGNLRERLERGPLAVDDAATILIALADALACAHARGVLHRDIKPGNVLFTADGHPLLSDFGVARRRGDAPLTEAGAVSPATAEYLDPAVAEGGNYDGRSDIYALGIVGYEILTGCRPFPGDTPLAVVRAADRGVAVPLAQQCPGISVPLASVIERAFAREPGQRPASAADLAEQLRSAVTVLPAAGAQRLPHAAGPRPPCTPPARPAAVNEPPTRLFGPRPPAEPALEPARPQWRRLAMVAALLALLPSLVVLAVRDGHAPPGRSTTSTQPRAATVAPAVAPARTDLPACQGIEIPQADRGAHVKTGDLTGSGCRSWIRTGDGMLTVALPHAPRLRLRLGGPRDTILLGDWDCNGSDTAALYRPATGVVYEFDAWPAPGHRLRSTARRETGVVNGTATTGSRGDCDAVLVLPALGT